MTRVDHAEASSKFIEAKDHADFHDKRLWDLRRKRDVESEEIPEWQQLRALASAIKEHTLTHLADYLEQFERNATANGMVVHWARDAAEHNQIVFDILSSHGATALVKSKSMLTDECEMRPFLENRDIEIIETDLGERIQQLDDEPPSHIVVPAVHKLRADVAEVFAQTIGTDAKNHDVAYLAESQRTHTRPYYLKAQAGMTGANFAVAESGSFVVCTNEGNADLSANLPKLHIASIGIEKLIPKIEHLGVFIRMLSRSALGSPITQITSHFRAPRPGTEMHVVLVDRPLGAPRDGGLLVLAQVHSLRRVHEHLPGVSALGRPELRLHLLRADRRHHRPDLQPAQIQLAAVRLDAQRQLHQRLPGEDQHPRADLQVAADHCRAPPAADSEARGHARGRHGAR
jgi:L-lactate dehydrogenase complex protein LldF